ncbi:hypothetical protein [Segatella copri]|uniref:hypothetical protein n=1 Tax=Segatella copri TaxID=165179 RepID=UPI00294B5C94|nr:hypothetical protein [Segatella copri]WOG32429.1 hypothetical protein RJT04_02065 [Segatella copri]
MRKLYPTYCRLIATLLLLGCSIALSAQGKTYHVKADSEITTSSNDGLSWENAITLTEALRQAKAGDEIWVKGYEDITGHIYKAPKGGFVLPSGVAMYGGFYGDETIKNDLPTGRHKYQMKYQTALVGDIDTNDKASQQLIIYPENTTRTDNAIHVLTLQMGVTQGNTNDGNKPTIVSGFLIAAGNAKGENTSANGRGGGIYVVNNSNDNNASSRHFRISQCNFANNYGMRGGAIYVDNSCTNQQSAISYCSIFNNVAGKRGSSENEGGGMWIDGTATVYNCNINNNTNGGIRLSSTSKIVNCSVIANTVSAVDLTTAGASGSNGGGAVYNTVLWHSTALSKQDTRPAFYFCAFPEVKVTNSDTNTDDNGNVWISNENHGTEPAPWFKQSAVNQGYDFSFSSNLKQLYSTAFTFEETSALLNKGKLEYYTNFAAKLETTSTDIMGRTRYQTSTIDIGAYEYARMKAGRIRYVKPEKEGKGDGSTWNDATDDIQWAINDLAEKAPGEKGEVWVAAGTYVVKDRILADDSSAPVSLLMKNGISVYGAFEGNEKSRSERIEKAKNLKPWGWKKESIIRGAEFTGSGDANWNNTDEAWNIKTSGSYHVVWFAPLPGGNAFTDEVYLEGFTIEGGKYNETNAAQYDPDCGAGVYINDPSARMRYCTVRFCNPGMKKTTNTQPRGGGIYCKNGQTEGNLVYNCSAYQGGGIYIDEAGFITRSMVTNCSAYQGAGVYLRGDPNNSEKAYYQILATSVISNNTSTRNGAVYLDGHGLVINNTIANNYTNNTPDAADEMSSYTGGVYIKEKGLLANNVIWNNSLLRHKSGTSNSASMAQIYAAKPSEKTVQFYNNAISDVNAAKWTNTYQSGTISINTYYSGKGFKMGTEAPYNTVEAFNEKRGVLTDMKTVNYYWETVKGTRLRNVGISYALLPSSYLYQPKIDLSGKAISSVPSAGAYMTDNQDLVFEKNDTQKRLRIYFDRSRELVDGTGESWEKSYTSSSVDEILGYLADIKDRDKIKVVTKDNTTPKDFTIEKNSGWGFEICSREGIFEPKIAYTFEETDARSCTFNIQPCVLPVTVYGGYPEYSENPNPKDEDRDPIKYRTELNGNLNGSELNEGLYHLVRIEAGANITIDGYAFTHAYAAGTAYMPYGGGVLIGSMDQSSEPTTVKLKNCIFENNTATDGGAIATMPDAVNVKLELENCVINNNTSKDPLNPSSSGLPSIIYLNKNQGSNNSLTLNHVSIINNEGVAPDYDLVKRTSYAVGNKLNINGTWDGSECKNSMDINTLGKNGALNFSNPTNEVGARMSGNVYYGGYSSFRPLTSSAEAGRIINSAQASNATAKDITGEDRNLGGAPDLGAYEALLPKAGKIIYVRSYNKNYDSISDANDDDKDGNPDFNLLNESNTEYDGSSWDKAIIGNAMCDNTQDRTGNNFYVKQSDKTLLSTTIDNTDYSQAKGKYRSETDSYGDFWTNSGNQNKQLLSGWGTYNKIANNREERYISGLQYAVERAAELNKDITDKKDRVVVWVGAGIYTDYKGFVVRDKVEVIGGFPYEGYPGEDDRHPLLSQYVPARKEYETLDKTKYETILQIRKESPVYFKNGDKEMWYQENNSGDGSKYDFTKTLMNSRNTERHYVLYQPDVCLPTWSPSGDGNSSRTDGNAVRYKGNLIDNINYKDYEYAKWDGFSVRHGYIINYPGANRDGGAGVRVFRGVELENLIIVNNFNHGGRVRGGGLYMDGENSKISNSYLLRNLSYANSSESYGGGAYMIQGTGYNLVVANNRCYNGTCRGGGIFLESAKFYNNTIAYNMATNGTGIYHWQDSNTGVNSQLSLYNCIIYDNYNNGKSITDQVNSAASGKMNPSHNCYMNSNDLSSKFQESDGNFTGDKAQAFPFEDQSYESGNNFRFRNARLKNNFRLYEAGGLTGNKCLNGGTTNVGNGIILPETDMDYTNRIKDCAIDIGAYEADNTANIAPQEKTNSGSTVDYIYYVTQNGWGNRSGDSPENAACADKLQDVLTAAGKKFETANQGITDNSQKHQVYVKVAGYQADETGKRFTYHANTLADPSDPQSYTFLIPNGVCLMGGYYEGDQEGGKLKEGTANWNNDKRDCISTYQTVLSAKTEVKEGSAVNQEVNGYHTVCFGKWPTGNYDDYNTSALTANTIIDGCRLIDGNASDKSGFKSMGGAAIVPRMAHVRNCEISDCQATQGGALMLLKGSIVSGSVIVRNKAQKGGAIYALRSNDKNEDIKNYHAYVISCTIARNEATIGGGIYQEENSLIGGNSVIWGNTAQTDNNISGDVNYKAFDYLQAQGQGAYTEEFYPYNYCFVEKMALPANRMNTEMTSDLDSYFNDNKIFKPRAYSPLIGNGVEKAYVNAWKKYGISNYDITGKERTMTKQQTAGAYASDLPAFNKEKLLKRLFVSQTGGEIVTEEEKAKYYGRSFLTPFNSLEAALDYINEARTEGVATEATHFEILMTGGTYKPSKMRQNQDLSPEQNTIDRRLQSFTIPVNVDIFGSFSENDLYSSTPVNPTTGNKITGDEFTSFGDKTLVPDGKIKDILTKRNANDMTDNNKNGLIEPWEFSNPTILSGDIKASEKERNVYHVVYSNAGATGSSATANNEVVLDGITIMNGETTTVLKTEEGGNNEVAEIGRGAGIYTNRVNYTLNRCRLIKNSGLHGGAVYVNNASLDIIGSTISGNSNVSEKASLDEVTEPGKGGAIYLYLTESKNGNLHIVNSLLANNDVTYGKYTGTKSSQGGAIYIRRANDASTMTADYQDAYIVNSLIVNNKAKQDGAIHVENEVTSGTITPILYNTAIWGNESTGNSVLLKREHMNNCAWDELPTSTAKDGNIKLNKENIASDGPRFTAPTTTKGYEGYTQDAKWNPQAISVLTDAGDGSKDANDANETGKYQKWWTMHNTRLEKYGYPSEYIRPVSGTYNRYVGPKDENGNVAEKPIDIGMYEFQYVFKFTDLEKVYIGTEEKGNGDGRSWDNQSTDLRGAIIAMANPSGNVAAGTTTNNNRKVFVRGGTYYSPTYSSGDAFSLIVNKADKAEYITSIELVGGCTGSKNADGTEAQDFSKPSVLIENPAKAGETKNLLNIVTNGKPVTISGFTFQNLSGVGVNAMVNKDQAGTGEEMRLHHCAFRENKGTGMVVNNQKGYGINMWNVLFADGKGNGLTIYGSQSADITNATFVCNKDTAVFGTQSVYNSVAWKNGFQNLKQDNKNVVIASSIENGDVLKGPNFVDPTNGDYRIRPSLMLLDKGSNDKYQQNVGLEKIYKDKSNQVLDYAKMFASEKDLGNTARLIGDNIDIGAYECDTKMIQIIYVKEGSAVAGTGESWYSPTNDLQGAINLAELYANKNEGKYGYVFVDRNLKADNVNISMPGVKMFGSMREEKSSKTEPEAIVKDLLTQRKGIIESSSQSTINGLTLNSGTTDTRMCLVDGFKVSDDVSLQGYSMLSTSILDANAKVSGDASSLLYNSLALGSVKDVKSVNVTASGTLPSPDGSAANRASVNTYNKYVKDEYWKYQLDETSKDINANTDASATNDCIKKVMHDHELAGNQRIRDNVDNGCFETWYLTENAEAKKEDYPHGKSVVYVMAVDKELKLDNGFYTETNPFSPGFLLLKHHAGLRGNNSYVNLTNFAVERNLKAGTNFFSMPFKATNMEVEGTNNPADGSVIAYYYNAATRAKYDYKFDQSESKAWVKGVDNQRNFTAGLRMEAKADKTVRFYGNSYTENGSQLGQITLVQNNNQQPWSSSDGSGTKFTHKENMGWNLFGSPYLCAMNYSDMEYGRVIYQCEENGSYKAINTYDSNTGNSTDGYIPAMDAVFTQTATLENSESVRVSHSEAKATTAYQATRALDIAITQSSRASRAGNGTPVDDQLQLNAVPAQEAKSDFDMGSDGVKWMASQNAQIYASRNGGRYSLLSAISIDAELSIGVSLPETGEYTISIPEDCDASEYETVWLKDKETGKAVDLKEGSYLFKATQTGEMNNRFNISFNRKETDMNSDITIIPSGNYQILIKGLKQNDLIRIYGTSGVLALQKQAKSDTEQLRSPVNGTVAVEVTRGGKQIAVKKIALK